MYTFCTSVVVILSHATLLSKSICVFVVAILSQLTYKSREKLVNQSLYFTLNLYYVVFYVHFVVCQL